MIVGDTGCGKTHWVQTNVLTLPHVTEVDGDSASDKHDLCTTLGRQQAIQRIMLHPHGILVIDDADAIPDGSDIPPSFIDTLIATQRTVIVCVTSKYGNTFAEKVLKHAGVIQLDFLRQIDRPDGKAILLSTLNPNELEMKHHALADYLEKQHSPDIRQMLLQWRFRELLLKKRDGSDMTIESVLNVAKNILTGVTVAYDTLSSSFLELVHDVLYKWFIEGLMTDKRPIEDRLAFVADKVSLNEKIEKLSMKDDYRERFVIHKDNAFRAAKSILSGEMVSEATLSSSNMDLVQRILYLFYIEGVKTDNQSAENRIALIADTLSLCDSKQHLPVSMHNWLLSNGYAVAISQDRTNKFCFYKGPLTPLHDPKPTECLRPGVTFDDASFYCTRVPPPIEARPVVTKPLVTQTTKKRNKAKPPPPPPKKVRTITSMFRKKAP